MGHMAAPGSVFQAPLTSARTEGGAWGRGSQALWHHVTLTTTRPRAAVSFTHFRDKETEAQPSRGRAGSPPEGWGEGLRLQAGHRGELEGGTWGPHPHPELAVCRDTRIPELGQAAAS